MTQIFYRINLRIHYLRACQSSAVGQGGRRLQVGDDGKNRYWCRQNEGSQNMQPRRAQQLAVSQDTVQAFFAQMPGS
jgi:hypothetical protein